MVELLEIEVDEVKNRYYPHAKVLEAYADEKKGNGFPRVRNPQDDIYEKWYNTCKKNKFYMLVRNLIRTRTFIDGKVTEIIIYYCDMIGTASSGPNQGQPQVWQTWIGYYDEPVFNRKLDKDTDTFVVDSIRDHIRRYEIPFTKANLEKVYEACDDATVLLVKDTVDTQSMQIYDSKENYAKASFQQLLTMGRTKRSLDDITLNQKETEKAVADAKLVEAQAVKAEDKQDAKNVVEVAETGSVLVKPTEFKEETLDLTDTATTKVIRKGKNKK